MPKSPQENVKPKGGLQSTVCVCVWRGEWTPSMNAPDVAAINALKRGNGERSPPPIKEPKAAQIQLAAGPATAAARAPGDPIHLWA